jgi:TldD protein
MNGGKTALEIARRDILHPAGVDDADVLEGLLILGTGADLADLYFESTATRSWRLENGIVIGGDFSSRQGVGARASREGRVAFAHSADLRPAAMLETAKAVREMRRHGDDERYPAGAVLAAQAGTHGLYSAEGSVGSEESAPWVALLRDLDRLARESDPRVVRVDAMLRAVDTTMLVAHLDHGLAADVRPSIRLHLTVIAEAEGKRARGSAGIGGRHGLEGFTAAQIEQAVTRAVRIACVNLEARPAPVGPMSVVLAPGYPGVLFHEAVGHGLEGDHHRKNLSSFVGKMGERIAAPGVTVIDDGGIPGRLGSLGVDDEGTPAGRTVLVEDGILTGLMQDRTNASLMNARSTGNARRQSYAHLPMPRMTNTFLASGAHEPADIIASVRNGIYAVEFGGGQVDIVSGRFNFTTTEAWLIEDGKVTAPIDGATLIGVGHEALRGISMVGNDLALDDGEAVCGKQGQSVDVSVGQPTLRIDNIMVGGRAG